MSRSRHGLLLCAVSLQLCFVSSAAAINVNLDYTYDTSNFFGSGNPDGAAAGAQAKATLESVADFYSEILTDTFSEIRTPDPFSSSAFSGVATWDWSLNFINPTTASSVSISNPTIAADEYRIYVGARNISNLGIGGPGGFGWSSDNNGGGFTSAEINQIDQIHDDFVDDVENREETSGFARWGGAVTFDSVGRNWHYDHIAEPSFGESDFFSVAIHEIGHAVGLGASDNWNNWVSGTNYTGPQAVNLFGGLVPLDCVGSSCGHWAEDTESVVFGTSTTQEAAMDPNVTTGSRKRLTALDAAALEDIGWNVETPVITYASADYNTDGDVDGGDLTTLRNWFGVNANGDADGDGDTDGADLLVWQQQYTGPLPLSSVPEPTSGCLLVIGLAMMGRRRR